MRRDKTTTGVYMCSRSSSRRREAYLMICLFGCWLLLDWISLVGDVVVVWWCGGGGVGIVMCGCGLLLCLLLYGVYDI